MGAAISGARAGALRIATGWGAAIFGAGARLLAFTPDSDGALVLGGAALA